VEIKCQLDATEVFLLQILLLAQHVSGHHYAHHQELKGIIQWLLRVVFRAVVFKLLAWCGAEGYVSGLQDAAASFTFTPGVIRHCPVCRMLQHLSLSPLELFDTELFITETEQLRATWGLVQSSG